MTIRSAVSFHAPAACALLFAALSGTAQASFIIDFESLAVPGNPAVSLGPLNYVEDGYRLVFTSALRYGTGSSGYHGSTAVWAESFFGNPPGITLTQVASGGFDLLSIDVAELINVIVYQITVTGFFVGGGSISTTLSTDGFVQAGSPATFETFALTGFTNLAEVRFSYPGNAFTWPQIDNLVVQPTIPTPGAATAALAMTGLLAARRRRA
jgi:hypothetical protein